MKRRRRRIRFRIINRLKFVYFIICLCVIVLVGIISILLVGSYVSGVNDIPEVINVQPTAVFNIQTPMPTTMPTPSPTPEPRVESGYINKSGVNFRENPQGNIITSLRRGSKIDIIGDEMNGWYYIRYEDTFGYVSCEFVSFGIPPTPSPTPRYGKWEREDYLLLATTIYCEASARGGLQEAVAVGWVIRNRLEDESTWGDETWLDVISREGQFSVYKTSPSSKFQRILKKIAHESAGHFETSKRAARYVMQGRSKYKIPEDIQFFCSDSYYNSIKKSNGNWGSHKYYKQIGDTVFFHK